MTIIKCDVCGFEIIPNSLDSSEIYHVHLYDEELNNTFKGDICEECYGNLLYILKDPAPHELAFKDED